MRLPGWFLGLPLALLFALFAVSNRASVALELWPLPGSLEVPIYFLVVVPLLLGLILGAGAAIVSGTRRTKK